MMQNLKDIAVRSKRILVRCDFNVPLDETGNIMQDFKLRKSLPTIQYLVKHKARVILMSHLGEPTGVDESLCLDRVRDALDLLLGMTVQKVPDCVGEVVENAVDGLQEGEVLLLENLRFHPGEVANDPAFAQQLASLGEAYVNDAFASSHRAHASIVGVPALLPHAAGLLLEDEVKNLDKMLQDPEHPMVAVLGGVKAKTKVKFIDKISEIADEVLVSGLMKQEMIEEKLQFTHANKIIGPDKDLAAPDIDPATVALFKEKILAAKTVFWNGPFGKFEQAQYKKGTLDIVEAIVNSAAFSVAGGGETVEFLANEGLLEKFSHVSTGGGAMLDYLSGEVLPGLRALEMSN